MTPLRLKVMAQGTYRPGMMRVFESLRSFVIWIIALPVFVLGCLVILLVALFYRGRRLEGLIKACCRLVLFVSGVRLRVRGRENVEAGRRYVVMMNHVNIFDPLVFYAAFPGPARGIEEESHFRWPLYGAVLRRIGMVPIDRKNSSKSKGEHQTGRGPRPQPARNFPSPSFRRERAPWTGNSGLSSGADSTWPWRRGWTSCRSSRRADTGSFTREAFSSAPAGSISPSNPRSPLPASARKTSANWRTT